MSSAAAGFGSRLGGRVPLAVLALLAAVVPTAAAGDAGTAPPAGWHVSPLELDKPSAGFRVRLKGYLQVDFRSYAGWTVEGEGPGRTRAEPLEWRRLRVGFEGGWKRLSFDLAVDPAFDRGDQLKDASLGLRVSSGVRLHAGYLKMPVSPEFLGSPAMDDSVERAAVVDGLAPGRDWGVLLRGTGRRTEYQVGLFEGDGRGRTNRAGTTAAGRLTVKVLRWLDAGTSLSRGEVRPGAPPSGGVTPRNGLSGRSLTGFSFAPPVLVDGARLRWGADLRFQKGPVSLWGELLGAHEEPLPSTAGVRSVLRERGWSATATWLVTGERKTRAIGPDRPLFAGPGAIEVIARCESVRFDGAAGRRTAGFNAVQGGLSWWPSRFLRFMGDVVVESYDDPLRAPEPGRRGPYVSLLARAQVHIPRASPHASEP